MRIEDLCVIASFLSICNFIFMTFISPRKKINSHEQIEEYKTYFYPFFLEEENKKELKKNSEKREKKWVCDSFL